jgi:RNA polymerase sigma factor for flagellar operon FliA
MSVAATTVPGIQNGQTEAWLIYHTKHCECHRNDLVVYYFPIVRRVASKIHRRLPEQVDLDDMVSLGTLGLFKAVSLFDPYRGKPFEPVAAAHIRSVILDSLRTQDWAPRSVRRHQREMDIATDALAISLRREPTHAEIAEFLGHAQSDVAEWLRETSRSRVGSLDEPTLTGSLPQVPDPRVAGAFERRTLADLGMEALMSLPLRQRAILALHHYEGMDFAAVAAALRLPVEEVQSQHAEATRALRDHLALHFAA